jgi:hypothetical protein
VQVDNLTYPQPEVTCPEPVLCVEATPVPIAVNVNLKFIFFKAMLRVLSNPAVLALLKIIWRLLKPHSNNEVLRDLIIPVTSP